ncbi:MAG: DUF2490 domain-containing protein [Tannerellaceae bacterium]|nr:DUF2490 domain-containing protein [Tannerellaceae bacterium]MCD8264284.1 DUF2490 domain-containing protein [Tannerellaceae bacterium]
MKHASFFILAGLLFVWPFTGSAQNDFGTATRVEITKKLLPGLNILLEEEFRSRDNLGEADRFSTTLQLSYRVNRYLKAGGAYNLINYNHPKRDWEVRHRYYFFATGSYRFDRFTVSLRERFQSTYWVGVDATSKRANPKLYLRSRLQLEYNIRKSPFEPYASIECYNTLNDPQGNTMNKLRYTAGTGYRINKRNALQLYYRYINFTDDDDSSDKHMLGIGYAFKF